MGAAIFPETSKYGGGPEKMAIVAVEAEMAAAPQSETEPLFRGRTNEAKTGLECCN